MGEMKKVPSFDRVAKRKAAQTVRLPRVMQQADRSVVYKLVEVSGLNEAHANTALVLGKTTGLKADEIISLAEHNLFTRNQENPNEPLGYSWTQVKYFYLACRKDAGLAVSCMRAALSVEEVKELVSLGKLKEEVLQPLIVLKERM